MEKYFRKDELLEDEKRASVPQLDYGDALGFIFLVCLLGTALRIAKWFGWLPADILQHPSTPFQISVTLALLAGLYAIIRLRHTSSSVLILLGWTIPAKSYFLAAIVGGAALSLAVKHSAGLSIAPHVPSGSSILLAAIVAPILEESLLRGLLLPVLARSIHAVGAVSATALLFAAIHGPPDLIHWFWLIICGVAYGAIRLRSESTTAAGMMHSIYNLVLLVL